MNSREREGGASGTGAGTGNGTAIWNRIRCWGCARDWMLSYHGRCNGRSFEGAGNILNGEGQLAVTIPPNTWSRELELHFAYNDVDTVIYGDDAVKIPGRVSAWVVLPDFLTPKSYRGPIGILLRGGPLAPQLAPAFSLTAPTTSNPSLTEFEIKFGMLSGSF